MSRLLTGRREPCIVIASKPRVFNNLQLFEKTANLFRFGYVYHAHKGQGLRLRFIPLGPALAVKSSRFDEIPQNPRRRMRNLGLDFELLRDLTEALCKGIATRVITLSQNGVDFFSL